jgi:hypothetical protein
MGVAVFIVIFYNIKWAIMEMKVAGGSGKRVFTTG